MSKNFITDAHLMRDTLKQLGARVTMSAQNGTLHVTGKFRGRTPFDFTKKKPFGKLKALVPSAGIVRSFKKCGYSKIPLSQVGMRAVPERGVVPIVMKRKDVCALVMATPDTLAFSFKAA